MKVLSRAVLAAAMVLVASSVQAQTSFSVAAGATMPIGDTGDGMSPGYHATVGLGIKPPLAPIGARIEGMFNSNELKPAAADASARIMGLIANATFAAMPTAYVIGGLGFYNMGCSGCGVGFESENKVGFNVGGGLNIPLTGLGVFVEARLHIINTDGGSTKILPVSVGIKF
jgi:Outer membrane protein beta-barrel domain